MGNLPFLDCELHSYFAALAAKHGPVFRLRLGGKLGVVVSSEAAAREVLREQDAPFANRDVPAAARVILYEGSDVAWSSNGPTWRMLRKLCVRELLNESTLVASHRIRRREVRAMATRMAAAASNREAVDIGTETFVTVMNIMTNMLWGGGNEADECIEVIGKEFRKVVGGVTALVGTLNLSDFFPWLRRFDMQGIEKKMWVYREALEGIFERIIAAKEKKRLDGSATSEGDFLDVILRMERENGDGKTPFTMTHVKALLMDMVLAGTDTVSNAMEFVLAEMINRPGTISAIQAELDEAVGLDCMVEESHLIKLRYLSAAIKEGLRLHPTLPLLIPHCPNVDCVVGGYTVPAGSRVFVNAWAIHRDPAVWKEPLAYKPERFLHGSEAYSGRQDFSGNDLSYIPFGSGRRICAGAAMAERTLALSLGTLLHAFDWQLLDGESGFDLEEKFGIVLKKRNSLLLVPSPRLPKTDLYQ